MQNASARLRRTTSARSNRPIRSLTFPSRTVTGLSAMICDARRNPFRTDGSMVTRKSGASLSVEVIWHTMTDACSAGNASLCTTDGRARFPIVSGCRDRHYVTAYDPHRNPLPPRSMRVRRPQERDRGGKPTVRPRLRTSSVRASGTVIRISRSARDRRRSRSARIRSAGDDDMDSLLNREPVNNRNALRGRRQALATWGRFPAEQPAPLLRSRRSRHRA